MVYCTIIPSSIQKRAILYEYSEIVIIYPGQPKSKDAIMACAMWIKKVLKKHHICGRSKTFLQVLKWKLMIHLPQICNRHRDLYNTAQCGEKYPVFGSVFHLYQFSLHRALREQKQQMPGTET